MSTPEPQSLRALIFDFDHTLTDFGRWVDWQGARAEVVGLYESAGVSPDRLAKKTYAFGLFAALDEALAVRTSRAEADVVRDHALAALDRFEHGGAGRASWLPGVPALLDLAAERDFGLAIVSANGEAPIRASLERLGALERFTAILGRSPLFPPKPAPNMHCEVLRRFAIAPGSALAIGDSPNDVRAAAAADILTVGVLGGEGSEERLFGAGATWVLQDLTALPALLALWSNAV
ncbi:MAG: HAD family hydrolase [Candidatus Binatia bacterium]